MRTGLALFAMFVITTIVSQPAGLATPVPNTNIETKVLVSAQGAIHVLWTVPGLNGSTPAPGIWYSKYNPNGTDSIPPTLIWNSSDVQSADISIDRFGIPHLVWAEGETFNNMTTANPRSMADSQIYYLELNITTEGKITPRPLTDADGITTWPSIAVDQNLTSHIIWTRINKQTGRAGTYYGIVRDGGVLNQTTLVAEYNRTSTSITRSGIAYDDSSGNLHIAWGESDLLPDGSIVSTVNYERLGADGMNLTKLRVVRFEQQLQDLSVRDGPNGSAYVVWQAKAQGRSGNAVYVSKISRGGKLDFIRQVSQPSSPSTYITLSEDSQENFYVVWYQPPIPPTQHTASVDSTLTSVAYERFDNTGAPSLEGTQSIRGAVIAVTVSNSGDILAISTRGVIQVNPPATGVNPLFVGIVVAAFVSIFGSIMTEEGRYRAVRQIEPLARRFVKRDRSLAAKYQDILGVLSRKPGLRAKEIRRSAAKTPASLAMLALLEEAGYVSSMRDGLTRRFYSKDMPLRAENSSAPMSVIPIPSRILHEIERNPGIWEAKISETLNRSQQIVHYHLKRLVESKLITSVSLERRKLYRLSNSKADRSDKSPDQI